MVLAARVILCLLLLPAGLASALVSDSMDGPGWVAYSIDPPAGETLTIRAVDHAGHPTILAAELRSSGVLLAANVFPSRGPAVSATGIGSIDILPVGDAELEVRSSTQTPYQLLLFNTNAAGSWSWQFSSPAPFHAQSLGQGSDALHWDGSATTTGSYAHVTAADRTVAFHGGEYSYQVEDHFRGYAGLQFSASSSPSQYRVVKPDGTTQACPCFADWPAGHYRIEGPSGLRSHGFPDIVLAGVDVPQRLG